MKCCICNKGPADGVTIHRINAKGVLGVWACEKHLAQTDAPPIDPLVREICSALDGEVDGR
jgi:hypothetical protein